MLAPALAELQADPAAAEAAAAAFQRLKPICAQLLRLRQDPQALTAALRALGDSIADLPAAGLRRCYDYITYPLLFMLDAAAAMRAAPAGGAAGGPAPGAHASTASSSSSSVSTGGGPGRPQQALMSVPAMQQDAAVEALLRCVLLLLQRCKGLEADQLLPMLQHVGVLLQLPRATLSEEVGGNTQAEAKAGGVAAPPGHITTQLFLWLVYVHLLRLAALHSTGSLNYCTVWLAGWLDCRTAVSVAVGCSKSANLVQQQRMVFPLSLACCRRPACTASRP